MTFDFWMCGSCNVPDEYNPFVILRNPLVQEIAYCLNKESSTAVRLAAITGEEESKIIPLLAGMEKTGIIISESERYQLSFSLFTAADRQLVWPVATEVGTEIAHHLIEAHSALTQIASKLSAARYIETERLLLAVVGCFALDWAGLEHLEQTGYLVRHKVQPGDGDYVLFGAECGDDVKKRFCYGHSDGADGCMFTTFGDITGRRDAFPDLLWQVGRTALESGPASLKGLLRTPLKAYLQDLLVDAARLLEILAQEPLPQEDLAQACGLPYPKVSALVPLLTELGYLQGEVEALEPAVPVFLALDKPVAEDVVGLVLQTVSSVVPSRYDEVSRALQALSAMRNGVPFGEVFTEIWHFIFAEANRILVEKGLLAMPDAGPDCSRFAAWLSCPGSH